MLFLIVPSVYGVQSEILNGNLEKCAKNDEAVSVIFEIRKVVY
jgi:hypothetical protein